MQCLRTFERCQQILFCSFLQVKNTHPPSLGLLPRKAGRSDFNWASEFSSERRLILGLLSASLITHHWHLWKVNPDKWIHSLFQPELPYGYSTLPPRYIYLEKYIILTTSSAFCRSIFCSTKLFSGTFPRSFWKMFLPPNLPSMKKGLYFFVCLFPSLKMSSCPGTQRILFLF